MGKKEDTNEKIKEKCFVIMPISDQGDYPVGHFTKIYEQIIKPAVTQAGYMPYRIDKDDSCESIPDKIVIALKECPMAICDLSNRNPNVMYELGLRRAYGKPVVQIQDDKTEKIFDVGEISTVFYKSGRVYEDVLEARKKIKAAILATRDGKMNSPEDIWKAKVFQMSSDSVPGNDSADATLTEIYNELKSCMRLMF